MRRVAAPLVANRNHPINVGRTLWLAGLPGRLSGGHWIDLVGGNDAVASTASSQGRILTNGNPGGMSAPTFVGNSNTKWFSRQLFPYNRGAFSMGGWFYQNGTPFSTCLMGEEPGGAGSTRRLWVQSQKVRMRISTSDFSPYEVAGATAASGNTWHHAFGTYDGNTVAGKIRVYLDGVEDGSYSPVTGTATPPSNGYFFLGFNSNFGDPWDGRLTDLGYWTRCLNAQEVMQLYLAPRYNYAGLLVRQPDLPATFPDVSSDSWCSGIDDGRAAAFTHRELQRRAHRAADQDVPVSEGLFETPFAVRNRGWMLSSGLRRPRY